MKWEASAIESQAALKACAQSDSAVPEYSAEYKQWGNVIYPVGSGYSQVLEHLAKEGTERNQLSSIQR